MSKIRVIIADDHPAFREGLSQLLGREEDIEIVAQAADGQEAVKLTRELEPSVALIDIAMPVVNGIEAAKQIKNVSPKTAVIILTAYDYQSYVLACLQVRVAGYLLKNSPVDEIVTAIRSAHSGHGLFDLKSLDVGLRHLADSKTGRKRPTERLHDRELEVLKLVAQGKSNKEIAQQLFISERTVQTHMHRIFEKIAVGSRTEAVLYSLREGWLTMEDLS